MISTGTVDQLIESCSRRGNIPNSQMTYLTDDFLAIMNEELMAFALPLLHARREDYYLEETILDVGSPHAYVGNPSGRRDPAWMLPTYAMTSAVRDVQAIGTNGDTYNFPRINADEIPNTVTLGWYFYGNMIALHYSSIAAIPEPAQIRVIFHTRPNQMTLATNSFRIFKINQPGQAYTVSAPQAPAPYNYNDPKRYDFLHGTPGYEILARYTAPIMGTTVISTGADPEYPTWNQYSMTASQGSQLPYTLPYVLGDGSISGSSLVASPSTIQPGDWVCETGKSCVVPLPLEMHSLLSQRMVVKFLEAQGDQEQLQQARESLHEMATQIPLLLQPRAEGKPRKIVNRIGLWRRWRW